jgi:FkbM family methyltransferase
MNLEKKYQDYFNNVKEYWYVNYTPSVGDIIFDIGAGRGEDSIPFSCHVGNEGKVISIEANSKSFTFLKNECDMNNIKNIIPLNIAITDFKKNVYIQDNGDWITNTLSNEKDNSIKVEGGTLDSVCLKLNINKINFLKMNIEGAELEAINGMVESIKLVEKICICCHDFRTQRGEDEKFKTRKAVIEFLEKNQFYIFTRSNDNRDYVRDHIFGEKKKNHIPNILHMIWVGDNPPPEYFYKNQKRWKELMPNWDFKIWTNSEIEKLNIDSSYLKLINKCLNGAQKADLLKYYVVNKFGGYYVDADVEPERSLNEINSNGYNIILCHDLEITWEYIAVGFFGASTDNPILESAIQDMFTINLADKAQHLTTGPGAMGRAYFKMKDKVNGLILPYWYFYRNKKGDTKIDGTIIEEDIGNIFGSHRYAATWI